MNLTKVRGLMSLMYFFRIDYLYNFGVSLLAFVYNKVWPVYQVFVYLFQCFLIVLGEFHFFPHLGRRMGPLYCFHIKITNTYKQQKNNLQLRTCAIKKNMQRIKKMKERNKNLILIIFSLFTIYLNLLTPRPNQ